MLEQFKGSQPPLIKIFSKPGGLTGVQPTHQKFRGRCDFPWSPGFGRGAKNFYFRFGNLHFARRHAAHGKAMHCARGFGGMPPRDFFKMVRFGVYFDQILLQFFI